MVMLEGWDRRVGVLGLTHVACPCVEEEDGSLGDHDALVSNVSDGGARESQAEDGEIT